ncbi:MAG: hypothetical protein P8Y73_10570, partial [Desulfuromonadales bacterium]
PTVSPDCGAFFAVKWLCKEMRAFGRYGPGDRLSSFYSVEINKPPLDSTGNLKNRVIEKTTMNFIFTFKRHFYHGTIHTMKPEVYPQGAG